MTIVPRAAGKDADQDIEILREGLVIEGFPSGLWTANGADAGTWSSTGHSEEEPQPHRSPVMPTSVPR
jgi:hypothetical protein